MKRDELLRMRQQIVDESLKEVLNEIGGVEEQFDLMMQIIKTTPLESGDILSKALDIVNSIKDPAVKADARSKLLDAIDAELKILDNSSLEASPAGVDAEIKM
jgi:hypothetical protein